MSKTFDRGGRRGGEWVASRIDDFATFTSGSDLVDSGDGSAMLVEGEEIATRPEVVTAEPVAVAFVPPVDDLAFEVVVEGMAGQFADEREIARVESERTSAVIVADEAPAIMAEPEAIAAADLAVDLEAVTTRDSARLDRLNDAVRLTRRAVEAWASVIDGTEIARGGGDVVLSR